MRDCVNLTLQNISELALQSRIRFQVMDKDTFSCDDLVGEVDSHVVPFLFIISYP